MSNEHLIKFIDSVITGDDDMQRQSFSAFTQEKTKQILGLAQKQPEPTVMESMLQKVNMMLNERNLNNEIELDGNTVYVKGKRVGYLKYEGSDEYGDESQLYFVDLNGAKINILNNDLSDLMHVLTKKFLEKGK